MSSFNDYPYPLAFICERSDPWQFLSFQELQRCAASSRDVGHLLSNASHGDRGRRIASPNNRVRMARCDRFSQSKRTFPEWE
jgi:hypothetical protein